MYRQHRTSLYSLGDKRRGVLYASVGALLTRDQRAVPAARRHGGRWRSLVAAVAVYAIFAIVWSAREY